MYDAVVELITCISTISTATGIQSDKRLTTQVAYAEVESVSRDEWLAGGAKGLNPTYRFRLPRSSYAGEVSLIYGGRKYAIYRTYESKGEIELYAQIEAGETFHVEATS